LGEFQVISAWVREGMG